MPQRVLISPGMVQVPPARPVLVGGYTQVPLRTILPGGITQVGEASPFIGPLDGYTTGLQLAYSVSRRLLSSWTGNLINVRRSSDDDEQEFGPGPMGNLDTTALLDFVGAGDGLIVSILDQSGNGRNLTESTPSAQSRIVTSGILQTSGSNNRPCMPASDASTQYRASFGSAQTPDAFTWSLVGILTPAGGYNGLLQDPGQPFAANGSICLWVPDGAADQVRNFTDLSPRGNALSFTPGDPVVVGVECGESNVTLYKDGTANTPAAYDPVFSFETFGLWVLSLSTGACFAEGVLWFGEHGSNLTVFQPNQNSYFGI